MWEDTSMIPQSPPVRNPLRRWVVLGAVALALASCSQGELRSDTTPSPDDLDPVSREQLFASMAGIATGDQARIVDVSLLHEEETLKGECMRAAGFDYVTAAPNMLTDYAPQTNVHDPEFAKDFGLGISAESFGGNEPNPNDRTFMGLSSSESDSWTQQDATCSAAARSAVDERLGDLQPLLQLADDVNQIARSDDGFLAAQAQWKQCMSDAGFQFAGVSFNDMFQHYLESYSANPEGYDRSEEFEAAAASVECNGDQWDRYQAAVDAALQQVNPAMFSSTRNLDS